MLVNSLRKLHEEVTEIKKALSTGGKIESGLKDEQRTSDYSSEFKLL